MPLEALDLPSEQVSVDRVKGDNVSEDGCEDGDQGAYYQAQDRRLRHEEELASRKRDTERYVEAMAVKHTEAKRRSTTSVALAVKIKSGRSHAQSVEFLKDLHLITEWGAVLSTRGRETVQLQAAQVGGICKLLGALHSEVSVLSRNLKEGIQELVEAGTAASEHREALGIMVFDQHESSKGLEQSLFNSRRELKAEMISLVTESKESHLAAMDGMTKSASETLERVNNSFKADVLSLGAAGENRDEALERLSKDMGELGTRLDRNFNRLRDERHRVDNLSDHALRAVGALDEVKRRLNWAEGAEVDVKTVARTVGGLKEEMQHLKKGYPDDNDGYVENRAVWNQQQHQHGFLQLPETSMSRVSLRLDPGPRHVPIAQVATSSMPGRASASAECTERHGHEFGGGVDSGSSDPPENVSTRRASASATADGNQFQHVAASSHPPTGEPDRPGSGEAHLSSSDLGQFEKRLAQIEVGEKEMLQALENLERRVSGNQMNRGTLETVKTEFEFLKGSSEEFHRHVSKQLDTLKETEIKHAVQSFRKSTRTTVVSLISPLQLFRCWKLFVAQRHQHRLALIKIKAVYSKRHVGSRVQSWNYISQKSLQQSTVDRIEHREEGVESQLETLAATVRKRERAAVEQAKDLNSRVNAVEKRLESHAAKKADHSTLIDMVAVLEERIDTELEPDKMKQNMQELWDAVKALETSKADVKMTDRNSKKVNELTMEVRQAVKDNEAAIKLCASYDDIALKANATVVEQVLVMLAQQADQLARLVSSDLNMFKQTLGRFLELSPDVRKAALSLGLQENEQCVTCRSMNRKLIVEPLTGIDGNLYRMSPESVEAMGEETQRVVNEKIKFPAQLMSSLAAGNTALPFGDSWAPVRPHSSMEAAPRGRVTSKGSARIFDPEEVDKTEHQTLLARIRKLVVREPGWLSGPDMRTLAGADVGTRSHKAPKVAVITNGSPENDRAPASPRRAMTTAAERYDDGEVVRSATARGLAGRPTSSGRSYFPASATNAQRQRTLTPGAGDTQLPKMKPDI